MLELLVSGLTFDLQGLAPANSCPVPAPEHLFGLSQENLPDTLEAIALVPAHHISGGSALIPIVQAMIGLAAQIALPLAATAVCWQPARSWMDPQYFSRIVSNWLSGGPFPALGLTALSENAEGLRSEGLAYFANQEVQVEGRTGEDRAQTAKLAIRLIDYVVRNGRFVDEIAFAGSDGEAMRIALSESGRLATLERPA